MKIIKGFDKAKPLLTREAPFELDLAAGAKEKKTSKPSPEQIAKRIISDVRKKGDRALFSYTKALDGAELKSLEVSKDEISAAYKKLDADLTAALKLAASRIEQF